MSIKEFEIFAEENELNGLFIITFRRPPLNDQNVALVECWYGSYWFKPYDALIENSFMSMEKTAKARIIKIYSVDLGITLFDITAIQEGN